MNTWRTPQLQLLCDGGPLAGALSAEVSANNHFGAAVWSAHLALSADPTGLAAWDQRVGATIEVQLGLGASGWTSLVTGTIDHLFVDPIEGLVTIEGRDLTAQLIEARIREGFANQTASEVAVMLAGRHGLAAQVTQTTTPIGRYYGDDHERVTLDRYARASTEWDLLVWLAQQEAFDVFISGTTLYFQPQQAGATPALVLQASQIGPLAPNVSTLRLERAMSLSGPIDVTVKSWNSQQQVAYAQSASRPGSGAVRNFVYVRPNMSSTGALTMAQQKLAALTQHEYVLTATLPGELTLMPGDAIQLCGTNSSFDQNYVVDELHRRFDMRGGFTETIRALTASPSGS